MKENLINFLKGFAIGTANVIPGVSGGTIALITGIFTRLIDSIKSFDLQALKLILKGKFKEFTEHTDFVFLVWVMSGVAVSIFTLAKLLEYLFINYPVFIWSYFFGLIVASVWFVGKTVEKWTFSVILSFVIGTAIALVITFLNPARENSSFGYLFLSGIVAICSMILPGLSGSFVLILMGEYELVLHAVGTLDLKVLIPVALGSVVGLLAFSHFLSWLYKKFKNQTIALLTGFILGSLGILWPWKNSFDKAGNLIPADEFGKLLTDAKVYTFERILPQMNWITAVAIILMILGFLTITFLEKSSKNQKRADAEA